MVDREVFDRRLAKLEQFLRDLRGIAGEPRERFLSDRGLQAQAERWLHLAAEAAIDLAHHLIADRGWATPSTYREAFAVLRREGVLTGELAANMERWAALRNILVHLYLDVDHRILHQILTRDLDQLAAYAASMQQAVAASD